VPTVGFLHTDRAHVSVFSRLVHDRAPTLTDVHLVDETLLHDLLRRGLDDDVRRRLGTRLGELSGRAVDAVVCTCVVLGEEALRLGASSAPGVPVFSWETFSPLQLAAS